MDQNQTIDNDLQKAIDSITNETNIDPVFSDPVAAPSSIPEGDTGELGEPVGPFTTPDIPMPIAEPPAAPTFEAPTPDYTTPLPSPDSFPPVTPPTPDLFQPIPTPPEPTFAPTPDSTTEPVNTTPPSTNLNMRQVKEAALRDLVPLVDRLNMSPSQRFNICRSIFEDLRDYTVLEQAYRAASEISDPTERAEALLYLVESIDKM